jgi:hypothetical protein
MRATDTIYLILLDLVLFDLVKSTNYEAPDYALLSTTLDRCVVRTAASNWGGLTLDLGSEIGHPDRGLSWCSSAPAGKCQDGTSNEATTVSYQVLSNSLFTYHTIT